MQVIRELTASPYERYQGHRITPLSRKQDSTDQPAWDLALMQ
jgi:hypothetical protein